MKLMRGCPVYHFTPADIMLLKKLNFPPKTLKIHPRKCLEFVNH